MKRYFLSLLILSSGMFTFSSIVATPSSDAARAAAITAFDTTAGIELTAGGMLAAYALICKPMTLIAVGTSTVVAGGCIAATLGVPVAAAMTAYGVTWMCNSAWEKFQKAKGN